MKVKRGKPLDVLSLKRRTDVTYVKSSRTALYESDLEEFKKCPVCEWASSKPVFKVYGAWYHQCSDCGHVFIPRRPTKATLERFYSSNRSYADTYTNQQTLETRVQQVAIPKALWMIERFKELYNRNPTSVLDVGAGGGHFVYACKELGLFARGIEISGASRKFCKTNFDLDLIEGNFIEGKRRYAVDIVTFWGVLEHVTNPLAFLNTARRQLAGNDTMIVVEVPRWCSVSTGIQRLFPNRIIRHLDPLGHIQFFTDHSFRLALKFSGFSPIAAWYFGMDAYELAMHLPIKYSSSLQWIIDKVGLSDTIVLAAIP